SVGGTGERSAAHFPICRAGKRRHHADSLASSLRREVWCVLEGQQIRAENGLIKRPSFHFLFRRATLSIHEVARRAKVSIATVSRTINGVSTVTPQLSRRVWRVIEELGYYPNTQARSLVSGRSLIFGLIVSEITNPFFPEIIQGFEDIAVQNNYEILTTSTVHDPKRI